MLTIHELERVANLVGHVIQLNSYFYVFLVCIQFV